MRLQFKQHGLTLLELMIAMLIGTLMILGATSMFIANKRVYKEVDYQGRLAENARFAMETITRDLRMTGYAGCAVFAGADELTNNLGNSGGTNVILFPGAANERQNEAELLSYTTQLNGTTQPNAIEGSESGAAWLPSGSTDLTGGTIFGVDADGNNHPMTMLAASDGFTVRYLEETGIRLCAGMATVNSDLTPVSLLSGVQIPAGTFVAGAVLAVSDCTATNIFQLTNTPAAGTALTLQHAAGGQTPGNDTQTLSQVYTATDCNTSPADILHFRARRYFIANDEDGNPAFYRQVHEINTDGIAQSAIPEEYAQKVVDGVDNMQILYGEDTDTDGVADGFFTATAVANWDQVVSVRLALLFRTVDQDFAAPVDTNTYQLLDVVVGPFNDQRRRKVVEVMVSLRNRTI